MNEKERRAIVWDTIERIAFQPSSDRDRGTWLGVYAKTLHAIWGMEPILDHLALTDHFDIPFLMLKCDYLIESIAKYSATLIHTPPGSCSRKIDVDPGFLSKASLHYAIGRYPHQQRVLLQGDIEAVVDGMLFHPRCHTHIEDLGVHRVQLDQDRGGLSSHEVRIGGGIENPYVFLFHLRYQFCLVSDQVRQTERQRLVDLFERSIKNNQNINARDLFDYKS